MEATKDVFALTLDRVKKTYMNRACSYMESYYSDTLIDLKTIEGMKAGDIVFFIIQPNCTHTATESDYGDTCDCCVATWGNYVSIRIEMLGEDSYDIMNFENYDRSMYNTKDEGLIRRYKGFVPNA